MYGGNSKDSDDFVSLNDRCCKFWDLSIAECASSFLYNYGQACVDYAGIILSITGAGKHKA